MLDTPFMLWELSVTEQRYRAVLEVLAGVPVTEVARRSGVSRQSVHAWLRRYREEGPSGPPLQGLRDTYTSARPMAAAIPCANSDTHPQSRRSFTENQALPCHSLSSSVPGLPGNAR